MDPFVGEIRTTAFNFAPVGWMQCNGQTLPISQYTALFSILGTYYGGDGVSNFKLPNLQGQTPTHAGQGNGIVNRPLGGSYGEEHVTLTAAQIGAHQHVINAATAPPAGIVAAPAANTYIGHSISVKADSYNPTSTAALAAMGPAAIAPSADGGGAHENRQPFLAMNYIIAVQGIFPSQN